MAFQKKYSVSCKTPVDGNVLLANIRRSRVIGRSDAVVEKKTGYRRLFYPASSVPAEQIGLRRDFATNLYV